MAPPLMAALAAGVLAWLWFLARGRASGLLKRALLRLSLVALVLALVSAGRARGLFARSSVGFQLAMLLCVLVVAVGYLYLIRFCPQCGRMVRNLKPADCPRCAAKLPVHGMTGRLRA